MNNALQEFANDISMGKEPERPEGAVPVVPMPNMPKPVIPTLPPDFENNLNYFERITLALERIATALEKQKKQEE